MDSAIPAPPVAADSAIPAPPTVNRKLTLDDALALAAANNVSLKQSRADVDIAVAASRSAKAQTRPGISTTTYGLLGDSNNIAASSPGVAPQNYFGTPARGVLDQNLVLMAPLFTGGKLSGQASAAMAQSRAASFTLAQTRLMIRESVTEAYDKALLQDELVNVAQSRLTAEDEQVRVTQERVNTGRAAPVDLLREQAEEATAKQGVLAAQNDKAIAIIDLKTVLGISQASEITLTDTLDSLSAVPQGAPQSLQEALRIAEANRPDLAAALAQVDAARGSARTAAGAYSPQVYALGMADASSIGGGQGRLGYTVGVTASLPLYDGGQRHADVDAAKARLSRAQADAQSVRQTVDQEAATAWLNLQTAVQQVETARAGVTAAQQAYDLATMRYNAGKSVLAERLDVLTALTRAGGELAEARAAVADARARMAATTASTL